MLLAQCKRFLSCLFALFFVSSVLANEQGNDQFQLSGFATLGAVYSDSKNYSYRKYISSDNATNAGKVGFTQLSLLGLQADWSISPKFDLVYQGVLRDLPDPSFDRYTTMAFLHYKLDTNWSVRVGRTAPDLFLLTEFRDIDFSYVWAAAPNEVYGIIPYTSADGVDVTYSKRALGGIFRSKFFTGKSSAEISTIEATEKIKIDNILGISLSLDHFDWIISVKHSQVTIANEPEPNALLSAAISQVPEQLWPNSPVFAQSLLMKGQEVDYTSISGRYQWDNWIATAEFSQINSKSEVVPKINSGYGALSYQIDSHQIYGIYAYTDSRNYHFDEPSVNEQVLAELTHSVTDAMNFFSPKQQTTSLGWRWDIAHNTALTLQWNHTKIEENGSTLWLTKQSHEMAEEVNTVLFSLSMVF